MITLRFDQNSLEVKEHAIHIYGDERNVHINTISPPTSNSFATDNGASFWLSDGQLYIDSVLTDVFINNKVHYRGLPSHISTSFRDYCEEALRKNILTLIKEDLNENHNDFEGYIIASFKQDDVHFEIRIPMKKEESYVVCFYLNKTLSQGVTNKLKEIVKVNHFTNLSINLGGTCAIAKTDTFNINDLYHVLSFVHDVTEDDDATNGTNCIA